MSWQHLLEELSQQIIGSNASQKFKELSTNEDRIKFCLENKLVLERLGEWLQKTENGPATPTKSGSPAVERSSIDLSKQKSHAIAESLRKKGNKYFAKRDNVMALDFYNKSIRFSPTQFAGNSDAAIDLDQKEGSLRTSSSDIALAYANRSAVLNDSGLYKESLKDIERALHHSYPDNLKYKLYKRKAEILLKHGKLEEAKVAIKKALDCAEISTELEMKTGTKCKMTIISDIQDVHRSIQFRNTNDPTISNNQSYHDNESIPKPVFGSSSQLIYAGNCVEIQTNNKVGRHLIATEPLTEGSIIIVEKPYASVLLPPWYETNCHNCYDRLLAPLPCPYCSVVSYCSRECQQQSWKEYHHFECGNLEVLHAIGVAHLALRIILVTSKDVLLKITEDPMSTLPNANSNAPYLLGSSEDGTYGKGYQAIYHLKQHSEDMEQEMLFSYILTATLLLMLLDNGKYFETWEKDSTQLLNISSEGRNIHQEKSIGVDASKIKSTSSIMKEEQKTECNQHIKLKIGGLLCRHMLQIVCNAHAISELRYTSTSLPDISEQEQVRIATAIYSTASLMNHSCDPTIVSNFIKNTLIIRMIKNVKPGEEIFTCYGPHYKRMPWKERQTCLKQQYFFQCNCTPCQEGFEKESIFYAFKCSSCDGPVLPIEPNICRSCKKLADMEQLQNDKEYADTSFLKGIKMFSMNEANKALSQLLECLKLKERILYKNHKEISMVHDAIARCGVAMKQYDLAREHLQHSVTAIENQFGIGSIELANELLKYSDILVLEIQVKLKENKSCILEQHLNTLIMQSMDVVHRASKIFTVHYGESYKELEDLRGKDAFLKQLLP